DPAAQNPAPDHAILNEEPTVTINGKAYIAGVYEYPERKVVGKTIPQLHGEVAAGALKDAGLTLRGVDGYFCASDGPGLGALSMCEYMGIRPRYIDSTDTGGSSYIVAFGHAARAIADGRCSVALITLAGMPRSRIGPIAEGTFGIDPI